MYVQQCNNPSVRPSVSPSVHPSKVLFEIHIATWDGAGGACGQETLVSDDGMWAGTGHEGLGWGHEVQSSGTDVIALRIYQPTPVTPRPRCQEGKASWETKQAFTIIIGHPLRCHIHYTGHHSHSIRCHIATVTTSTFV